MGFNPLDGDHPVPNGGADDLTTGPAGDTITDALEAVLLSQGAAAPVDHFTDSDNDGSPDYLEVFANAWPFDGDDPVANGAVDSDGDFLADSLEILIERLGGVAPLGIASDSDGDGAPDYVENAGGGHPVDADHPVLLGATSGFDVNPATGPNGDGISDALEAMLIRLNTPSPVRADSDTDGDGVPDYFEVRFGTNPYDADSPLVGGGADSNDNTGPPGDGISDVLERLLIVAGARGPVTRQTDTDGDGAPDYIEVFKGSDPFDEGSTIPEGTPPEALDVQVTGFPIAGAQLTASYRYFDAEGDVEGDTQTRWLKNTVEVPEFSGLQYDLTTADFGALITFQVIPFSEFAFPEDTEIGELVEFDFFVPFPSFDRGTGGPGGVGEQNGESDLRLWFDASRGVQIIFGDVKEVTRWEDQSGWGLGATSISPARRPELVDEVGPRNTPAVRFDGAAGMFFPRPVEDDFTLMAHYETTSAAGNGSWWLSPAIFGGETAPPENRDFHLGINFGEPFFVISDLVIDGTIDVADGLPHTITGVRTRNTGNFRVFSDGVGNGLATSITGPLEGPTDLYLGSSTATDGFWRGSIYEALMYRRVLTGVERNLIRHYLVGRHGGTASPLLFDRLDTHGRDLAGIGRASATAFVDDSEGTGIVRVFSPSAMSEGDYLLWGIDDPEDFETSINVPAPYPRRLNRVWAYTITDGGAADGIGTVFMRFRVGGDLFVSPEPSHFALLIDTDEDLADAQVHTAGASYDEATKTITFSGVDLSEGEFFFVQDSEPPGLVIRQGVRMVERGGAQPDAVSPSLERTPNRHRQQVRAESLPEEASQEPERVYPHGVIRQPLDLEVAGRSVRHVRDPGLQFGSVDERAPVFKRPALPAAPAKVTPDRFVEETIQHRQRDPDSPNVEIVTLQKPGPEVLRALQLQCVAFHDRGHVATRMKCQLETHRSSVGVDANVQGPSAAGNEDHVAGD